MAKWFAESNLTTLIYGPSGTGKELFVQSIHNYSCRCCSPFVAGFCLIGIGLREGTSNKWFLVSVLQGIVLSKQKNTP